MLLETRVTPHRPSFNGQEWDLTRFSTVRTDRREHTQTRDAALPFTDDQFLLSPDAIKSMGRSLRKPQDFKIFHFAPFGCQTFSTLEHRHKWFRYLSVKLAYVFCWCPFCASIELSIQDVNEDIQGVCKKRWSICLVGIFADIWHYTMSYSVK